jgi:hypothetical protein
MALIDCSECGREISDKAESCPGCGYKNTFPEVPLTADFGRTFPHPGEMPTISAFTLQNRFVQIGKVQGRTAEEIISAVGRPNSVSNADGGITVMQWIKASAFTGGFHIALIFDQNGICGGITHQSSN